MFPYPSMMASAGWVEGFIAVAGGTILSNTSLALPLSSLNPLPGDLLVYGIVAGAVDTLTGASAFTNATLLINTGNQQIFAGFKTLTVGDIATPPVFKIAGSGANAPFCLSLYRGATSAAHRTNNIVNNGTSLNIAGFAPAANTKGLVGVAAAYSGVHTVTINSGFTPRYGPWMLSLSDLLTGYAGGAVNVTGSTTTYMGGLLIELLG